MHSREFFGGSVFILLAVAAAGRAQTQGSTPAVPAAAPASQPAPPAGRRLGGFVPGQHRAPGDPAQIAHGKALYGVSCQGCHGADLRGGDLGGPNLLRSQVALSDQNGELILPIIQGSRRDAGMPAIPISPEDGLAVAAYIRSVVETIGVQGRPPSAGQAPPSILVGDAAAGRAYFDAHCASCHSPTGDLQGFGGKFSDPKTMQTRWVAGGGRRFGPPGAGPVTRRTATATVSLPSGEKLEGRLVRIDDFLLTLRMEDGTVRTLRREGDVPKVEIHDPMKTHRDLLGVYTDKDIHDVTAYLVTLK